MSEPSSWNLETWTRGFYSVYSIHDDEKSYSALWLPTTSHASAVAEAVRNNEYNDIIYNLGNVFAWVLSFAERFRLDLGESEAGKDLLKLHGQNWTEWILHKFPRVCHICGGLPCTCASVRDVTERRKDERKADYEALMAKANESLKANFQKLVREEKAQGTITLPQLADMFQKIYGGTLWGMSLSDVAYHFLEEIGEVSKEIILLEGICGKYTKPSWQEHARKEKSSAFWANYALVCISLMHELADVFSWVTALCFKVAQLQKPSWKPREGLIKLYAGEIIGKKSQMLVGANNKFVCRYCTEAPCRKDCPHDEMQKRITEAAADSKKKFSYELADAS